MTRPHLFLFAAALAAGCAMAAPPRFDLLIRGGQVVDGTGNPWFRADVAVREGRIAGIGRFDADSARVTVDAAGHVVSPGFIDIHSHSDTTLLEDGDAQSKIRQGVTTEVIGEGGSIAPYTGELDAFEFRSGGETLRWRSFAEYFRHLEGKGTAVNVASYVGLDNVWRCVMGGSHARPASEQLSRMAELVAKSCREGAFGLSSMLAMPPGSLTTTADIAALCRPLAATRGLFSTHNRNEGLGVMEAVAEAIAIGEQSGAPVDIIHQKIADQKLWGRMREIVALIDRARARGVDIQANVYPYTRGSNNLGSIIPPWAHEGGRQEMLRRLRDLRDRERMKREIREGIPGWYNHFTAVGGDWSRMLVAAAGKYAGKTMDVVLKERPAGRGDDLDQLFDLLLEEGGSIPTVYAHHTEEDMNLALVQPWCSIGSDGSALAVEGPLRRGNPHPRSFGTFPRVLGVYVRERGLLRLEEAIRKMTALNAQRLRLPDRGVLRPGAMADVVVFDPRRVIDRATYTDPFQYPEGIRDVIVNGHPVLRNGRHTGARPGRTLRSK